MACPSTTWRYCCVRPRSIRACSRLRSGGRTCRPGSRGGTKVPDPSGRAFLALLACASEGLSARRFSEYLSLGQVPDLELATGAPPTDREVWVAPADEDSVLPTPRVPGKGQLSLLDLVSEPAGPADVGPRCQPASGRRPGESGIRDADEVPVLEGHAAGTVEMGSAFGRVRGDRRLRPLGPPSRRPDT